VGTLLSFDGKLKIERIVLSGTIVKRYSGTSVTLLSQMRGILDTISMFRSESLHRLRSERSRKDRRKCDRCQCNPKELMDRIETSLLRDLTEFFSSLKDILETPADEVTLKCEICLVRTKRDALVLLDEALTLRSFALKEGLGIVEG